MLRNETHAITAQAVCQTAAFVFFEPLPSSYDA